MTDLVKPTTRPRVQAAARDVGGALLRGRPVLLAADGSPASAAAARVAAALADVHGAVPHAVRAYDTTPVAIPAPVSALIAAADALIGPGIHEPDVRAIRDELGELAGREVDWAVHVAIGTPAHVIVRTATQLGAALVVMGLRRHGPLDRLAHDETTLGVMRHAACPVLGVTPALITLPRCIVVGVDFSPASARAAAIARDVLGVGGTLVLVHVEPTGGRDESRGGGEGPDVVYELGVDAALDRLVTDLVAPADVTVRRLRLDGEAGRRVAETLFDVADEQGADVIAVGSHRHPWLDRALLGSVTTDLARDGRRSLLVVPPPPPPEARPLDVLAR